VAGTLLLNLAGAGIAIEAMHDGRRDVRSAFLYPAPFNPAFYSAPWRSNRASRIACSNKAP
jgi:hypothetical protein